MADDESWERRRIEGALERVFPQARSLELTSLANDGAFLVLLRLPTRIGEATVAIHRHRPDGPAPEEHAVVGLTHRIGSGHGDWHWLVEYDSQASEAEVLQLVVKQLLRDPQIGDPHEDDRQRCGSVDPDAPDVWWVCATGPHIFSDRPDSQAEDLECPVPGCGSTPLDHPYASEDQAHEVMVQRQGGA